MMDNTLGESNSLPQLPRIVRDMTAIGLVAVDKRMNIVIWNRFMEINSGMPADEVLGRNLFECFPYLPQAWLEKKLKTIMVLKNTAYSSWQQRPYLFEFANVNSVSSDIEKMYQDCSFWPLRNEDNTILGACISVQDVTETALAQQMLEAAVEQNLSLEETSQRDALTGMFNRRYFDEQMALEIQRAEHFGWDLCLAMLDIDFFKKVNDTYGHDAGDVVLKTVALILLKSIRTSDILCRFGGEEFALILPKLNLAQAPEICERILNAIRAAVIEVDAKTSLQITMSMGVSQFTSELTPNDLLKQADQALYDSKHGGRNRFTLYRQGNTD